MTTREIEFGLDSPAYVSVDESGQPLNGDVVIRNTVEEGVFADAVGIDSFNISEHYRPDFMTCSPRFRNYRPSRCPAFCSSSECTPMCVARTCCPLTPNDTFTCRAFD
jgi:hypothetical protein